MLTRSNETSDETETVIVLSIGDPHGRAQLPDCMHIVDQGRCTWQRVLRLVVPFAHVTHREPP